MRTLARATTNGLRRLGGATTYGVGRVGNGAGSGIARVGTNARRGISRMTEAYRRSLSRAGDTLKGWSFINDVTLLSTILYLDIVVMLLEHLIIYRNICRLYLRGYSQMTSHLVLGVVNHQSLGLFNVVLNMSLGLIFSPYHLPPNF